MALLGTLLSEPGALLRDVPFSKREAALHARSRRFVFAHAVMRDLPVLLVTHAPPAPKPPAGGR